MRSGQENVLPHTRGCLPHTRGVTELPNSILHQVLCQADLWAGTVPMSGDNVYSTSADVGALAICNNEVQFPKSMHNLFVCDISIPVLVLMFHVRDQSTFYRGRTFQFNFSIMTSVRETC